VKQAGQLGIITLPAPALLWFPTILAGLQGQGKEAKGGREPSRCARISFGTTVWCKAIPFALSDHYETQEVQMQMMHMELGFASELVSDTQKRLVNR